MELCFWASNHGSAAFFFWSGLRHACRNFYFHGALFLSKELRVCCILLNPAAKSVRSNAFFGSGCSIMQRKQCGQRLLGSKISTVTRIRRSESISHGWQRIRRLSLRTIRSVQWNSSFFVGRCVKLPGKNIDSRTTKSFGAFSFYKKSGNETKSTNEQHVRTFTQLQRRALRTGSWSKSVKKI